jgi:molecular chaperone DnaK (HSP70)
MRLGVDFGTTHTVVAAVDGGRYPVATFETPSGYADYLPGIATCHTDRFDFGWEAQRLLDLQPRHTVRSVKRRVGRLAPDEPLEFADLCALDLASAYLEHVRRELIEHSNFDVSPDEPLEAMVAVPANSSTRQRYLTMEAFKRAGFTVLGLISEPTAAAIEFAYRNRGAVGRRSPKRYVVVYDLGGGTFDVSAVSLSGRRFELLANEGIAELGGNDFDEIIMKLSLDEAGLADELDPVVRTRLLELCREAKEILSPSSRRALVDLSRVMGGMGSVLLDTNAIYDMSQPLIDRTIVLVQRVFERLLAHGIDPENPRELGAIYLVGGGSSYVPVARCLRNLYRRKIQVAPLPHAATAIGLAIAADPDAQVFVRETVTRHFGLWREGDGGRDKVFDAVLTKNVGIDTQGQQVAERRYRPQHRVGQLRYLECSDLDDWGQPSGDLMPWGEVYFPYDPALREMADVSAHARERNPELASEEIVEAYHYLADGTVRVEIANATRGYKRSYVLGRPLGE